MCASNSTGATPSSKALEPLDETSAANIVHTLKSKFGSDITTEFRTSPALLGGLRVKLGSDVWDGSVNSRLAAFSQQL